GTILRDLSLATTFPNRKEVSFTLDGSDGVAGTLDVKGSLTDLSNNPTLDLTVKATEALLIRLDAATAQTSMDLTLRGDQSAMALSGNIDVTRAELRLLNPNPPSVVDLDGVVFKDADGVVEESAPPAEPALVTLDIAITIPDKAFVRGRGLDSEWGGRLDVSGPANTPTVKGKIEARRGYLDFIGRAFDLTKGLIAFGGTQEVNPSIDVRLEREAHGITGKILVSGTATSPALSFESTPALAEDEVLPRVLFGRSKQSLFAPEGIQLAAGVATLLSGKANVVDQARAALGVDVLRIESGANEGDSSSLSVGRYLRDGVYVGGKQSLDGTASSIVIEVEVLDNVQLDADLGQNTGSSVGMSWRKDF
nr:translocation/assembly module TamB [Gammaproteobacteria bacterium]